MSLADQQWCPTSVQVTVQQARGLRVKGKSGTNDAYAVMQVGKEKFQTSVVEKSVAPVWGEEAAFDLPPLLLLHQDGGGGKERCTLHVHVLHRALVGPDKPLGQAVVNLLQLSEDKTRNKTEWFKLLDKTGKADKDRGEVLLDIQFMRNNMTGSMFDLSATGKSRSRLGKFKDKVRGKKKESDAASNVVPSFTQVLTDSDEEGAGEVAAGKGDKKKKHKMKSLFSHKSNLQKNMSQSMTVLTAKNLSLSGSQSSGLNVDPSEGKKKFKFLMHKRSNSSDGKDASSGNQKQGAAEQSNVCINGSHVYCDEPPPRASRTNSNFSLTSSGHGSMEDVPESFPSSVDSLRAVRQYSPWTEEEEEEEEQLENTKEDEGQLRREEEEKIRMEEEMREEERVGRKEEELERLADEKRRQEEEERTEEENAKREEEEKIRREEEERRRHEEEERVKREQEECERLVEQKRRLQEQERSIEEERVRKEEEERISREEERVLEEMRRKEEEMVRRQEEEREEKRIEEQERRRKEEEEKIRMEEERAREEREEEEERVRRQEEERKLAEEKSRLEEEEKRIEDERIRMEEEMAEEETRRRDEEEIRQKEKLEEQERRQREHEERIKKEEEEEKARREKEECERLVEEERKRIEAEEKIRRKEEERIRVEEERRKEEERVRRQEEEREQLAEEKRILEEQEMRIEKERKQREEEEMIRTEEKRILEEQERRIEKERKQREEEEMIRKEEKRILEEQERRIEKERKQREEEEMIRTEEKRRLEEEERAQKEKEEYDRLVVEKMRQQEQEKRKIEEGEKMKREERIRREEKAERERKAEARKLEKEKLSREAEELKRDNKAKHKTVGKKPAVAVESPAEVISTNPFDENFSNNPFEEIPDSPAGPDSCTTTVPTVQQRVQSAAPSVGSEPVSSDEKDPINAQRERRPAPQPPGRNPAERQSQGEQDGATQHLAQINKKSKDKDIKTVSVLPQRSVQMIAPLSRSPTETMNSQSLTQSCAAKETSNVAKHGKRTAPPRPRSVEEGPSSDQKTAPSSDDNIPHECGSEAKQVSSVYGLNPFEEDENAAQDDSTTSGTTGSAQRPPVADKDAASQTKIKSSKARAPQLPAKIAATSSTSINQNTEGGHVTGGTGGTGVTVTGVTHTCDPASEAVDPVRVQEAPLQESQPVPVQSAGEDAGGKKVGPPPKTSRRLQPVKPLNPLKQQSVSVVQGVKDNRSTGILCDVQVKTKVNDTGTKGPYSQLTQGELISLVLKQEKQLSERDKKISELEQYIDNLLVRVIEEKPSILLSLNALKKAA